MGAKFGFNSKDNAWATFSQVRIPRSHMLMGVTHLDRDGTFSIIGDRRVLYTTMMVTRLTVVTDTSFYVMACLQIALRYATCRR
jgi:acyl-CoA oxidase